MNNIINILLDSAQNAFLEVGVFVGAMLLFFGLMNYRYSGGLIKAIRKYKKLQVVFGSLLGMSPGCGGAIFVMPLYLRGTVTYGTVAPGGRYIFGAIHNVQDDVPVENFMAMWGEFEKFRDQHLALKGRQDGYDLSNDNLR